MPSSPSAAPVPDRVTRASRVVAVGSTFALIALCCGWELYWARIGHGSLALKAAPLALALPGLARHRLRTYRWLSLMVWLYVAEGATRLFDPAPVPRLAVAELLLALLVFAACVTQVRWRLAAAHRHDAVTPVPATTTTTATATATTGGAAAVAATTAAAAPTRR